MRSCHNLSAGFDDPNLVSCAGLIPVMALAERAGLHDLAAAHVRVPGSAGSNPGVKVAALVAGMVAGADTIDAMDLLRHGGMGRVLTAGRAPSTLGTFLRSFTFGHVRQLDAVASRVLVNLAGRAPLLVGADQQRRPPGQVHQHPRGHRVELADVAEGERPQERPQRRRCPARGQHPAHAAVTEQVHGVDGVRTGDHPRDQRRDLHAGVGPGRPRDPHVSSGQVVQPGPLGQGHDRDQPGARHQVRVIETRRDVVARSHLPDVLLLGALESSRNPIVPGQEDIRASRPAQNTTFTGGSRLKAPVSLTWSSVWIAASISVTLFHGWIRWKPLEKLPTGRPNEVSMPTFLVETIVAELKNRNTSARTSAPTEVQPATFVPERGFAGLEWPSSSSAGGAGARRRAVTQTTRATAATAATRNRSRAVSYTHLRAHETDSYLVC